MNRNAVFRCLDNEEEWTYPVYTEWGEQEKMGRSNVWGPKEETDDGADFSGMRDEL